MRSPRTASKRFLQILVSTLVTAASAAGCAAPEPWPPLAADGPLRPPPAEQLFVLGREAARAGDATRAEQYLLAALAEGQDAAAVLPVLLRVCISERRLRAALDHAERYLRDRPGGPELRYLVATLRLGLGEVGRAREELERLSAEGVEAPAAHFLLGLLLAGSDAALARSHLERYIGLLPRGPRASEAREIISRLRVAAESEGTQGAGARGELP